MATTRCGGFKSDNKGGRRVLSSHHYRVGVVHSESMPVESGVPVSQYGMKNSDTEAGSRALNELRAMPRTN